MFKSTQISLVALLCVAIPAHSALRSNVGAAGTKKDTSAKYSVYQNGEHKNFNREEALKALQNSFNAFSELKGKAQGYYSYQVRGSDDSDPRCTTTFQRSTSLVQFLDKSIVAKGYLRVEGPLRYWTGGVTKPNDTETWFKDSNNREWIFRAREQWTEQGSNLGEHGKLVEERTMEDLYEYCEKNVLMYPSQGTAYYLSFDENNILSSCVAHENIYVADGDSRTFAQIPSIDVSFGKSDEDTMLKTLKALWGDRLEQN